MIDDFEKKFKEGFIINYDEDERYYDMHIFESPEQEISIFQRTKINKDGLIEGASFSKHITETVSIVIPPMPKEKYLSGLKKFIKNLEVQGFSHKYFDLSNCESLDEVIQLLAKSDSRFNFKIKKRK